MALHLQLPDPFPLAKSVHTTGEMIVLARQLRASGLLKADWDPAKHPRWPAGSPDGVGGEFAPAGTEAVASVSPDSSESNPLLVPTQGATTLPIPFRLPGRIPLPSEVLPPPAIAPNIDPFTIPQNPYPEQRRCVREWAEATRDCLDLWADGLLGTDDYRGMGRTVGECIRGRVSEYCGGNRFDS